MAANVISAIRFDQQTLAGIQASLVETFNGDFQFWFRAEHWHRLTSGGMSDHVLSDASDDEFRNLLDSAAQTKHAATLDTENGTLLAIPIPRPSRKALVAVRTFGDRNSQWLQKLADFFQRDIQSQAELVSLRHENQAFLRQVTNDFEELTFLRSMAELLEISELSFDFTAMAETVLPTLKPLLEADGLILVAAEKQPAAGGEEPNIQVGSPVVWAGVKSIEPQDCRRLVERYRAQCEIQPVVKNNFDSTPEAQDFPGVNSFIIVPIVNGSEFIGWLLALNRNNERNINTEELPWEVSYLEFGTHEATLMSSSAAILATHARNVELFREREELLVSMVRALVSAIEAKDEYTRGHSERVALYGKRLAQELGLGEDYCERLYLTGLLHDVGKIGVRDAVLRKPDALTDDEFEEIKQHPDKGWSILQDLEPLNYVLPGVLHHHENHNGRGYPDGLAGDHIPLDGRILAVVDAFDAMTSDRPYRNGMPLAKAEAILKDGSGKQWDPEMIAAFFRAMPDILEIKKTYQPRTQPIRQPAQLA